ncbi:MAG: lytic transglycosylase domain-containing protein [Ideonella sp.]|nr:lytic transglycosylase domain-containing protein [Ideonella sp.]
MIGLPIPHLNRLAAGLLLACCLTSTPVSAAGQPNASDASIVDAREAARRKDRTRLAALRASVQAAQHPLTPWVEYWDLASRLNEAKVDEVEAFYARWPGSYVEDRLRNDWLLELGRRRDWANIARDYPRFRMNDDREVTCWWLLTEHLAGRDVRDAARTAWLAQRDMDEGCNLLATAMVDSRKFSADDVWRKARLAVEANRPGVARAAVGLLGDNLAKDAADAIDTPLHFIRRAGLIFARNRQELKLLAVMRLAANDADAAAAEIDGRSRGGLPPALAAWGWAFIGRQAAFKLSADAASHYRRAWELLPSADIRSPGWSDETLAWGVRAALRATRPAESWPLVLNAVNGMTAAEQTSATWAYWRARALRHTAKDGVAGDEQRAEARRTLEAIAAPLGFYQQLAAEDLGQPASLPPVPAAPTAAERDAARNAPGLTRALLLAAIGLRDEARREWNFTLRGMSDRELIAAARLACETSDWQICINTSERTRTEFDVATRYPMPFGNEIALAASNAGLDPALVFGLIRQETRFMPQIRSHVGAAGLMQLMPATARYMAKRVGLNGYRPEQVTETAINLQLGSGYLKLVMDDLGGSQALAAAAYNAGPGRPRKWRDGPVLETAAWAENVPFNETRDYVKKVLSNAVVYAAQLQAQPASLKARLGAGVGPRDARAAPANTELP